MRIAVILIGFHITLLPLDIHDNILFKDGK